MRLLAGALWAKGPLKPMVEFMVSVLRPSHCEVYEAFGVRSLGCKALRSLLLLGRLSSREACM